MNHSVEPLSEQEIYTRFVLPLEELESRSGNYLPTDVEGAPPDVIA